MREINIAEADIDAVATEIATFASDLPSPEDLVNPQPTAIKVIDCVLSLRRSYDKFVIPRLKNFRNRHPDIQQINDLVHLMANYPTPDAFMISDLDHNSKVKPKMLQGVVKFVCQIVEGTRTIEEEKEILKQWAVQARPQDYQTLNIRDFAIAGFQYLRMLFGADTTKPDVHIIEFLEEILNRRVSKVEAVRLLEAASERVAVSVRAVDKYVWNRGARGEQYAAGTNTVPLVPDIDIQIEKKAEAGYSEFWQPIRSGEFGELFAGKPVPIGEDGWISKRIRGRCVEIILGCRKNYSNVSFFCWGENRIERRDEIIALFPKADYDYYPRESRKRAMVRFHVINKGKDHPEDWDEIREKLVTMGTDIYNKIDESNL